MSHLPSSGRWEQQVSYSEGSNTLLNATRDKRTLSELLLLEASQFECDSGLTIQQQLGLFFRHKVDEIKAQAVQHKIDNKNGVTLTSMHGAKGLEFDVVFCLSTVDGEVPLRRQEADTQDRSDGWDLPVEVPCDVDEERRLFYVAMTRSDCLCIFRFDLALMSVLAQGTQKTGAVVDEHDWQDSVYSLTFH